MRRVSSYGGNYGLPASQMLKYKLSATSGMHLLSSVHEVEEHGMFSPSHSGSQVLHNTSRATRNFHFTMASLHGKNPIARSSSGSIYVRPIESTMYEVSGVVGTVPVLETSDSRRTEVATQTLPPFEDSAITLVEVSDETGASEASSAESDHEDYVMAISSGQVSLDEAATKIQALYKGFASRRQYMLRKNSAIRIQAALKRWIIRKQYTNLCKVTRQIQRFYQVRRSKHLLQVQILSRKTSATAIQAHARGFLVRHMVQRWSTAACCIQRCWKTHLELQASSHQAAAQIQRQWRCFKAKDREIANVVAANRQQQDDCKSGKLQIKTAANQDDWNTVQVDHLDHCLDTCLATLNPQMSSEHLALDFPKLKSFTSSSPASYSPKDDRCLEQMHSDYTDESNYRQKLLNEKRLQQVARVFLLQHHIALQQQRAKFAPPFPPKYQMEVTKDNYRKNTENQNNPSKAKALPHSETGDIILDVQYLLNEAAKLGAVSPVLYMQNDAVIDIKIEGTRNQDLAGFKQINAFLVVFVAVVIYTKTICQGVLLWARQPARKQ